MSVGNRSVYPLEDISNIRELKLVFKGGNLFLILADTATDPGMAQACLSAGLRTGADTQLMIYKRIAWGGAAHFGPIVLDAIRASRR